MQVRVLKKCSPGKEGPPGKEVLDTDTFTFDRRFSHPLFKVKINQIQIKETVEENKRTNDQVRAPLLCGLPTSSWEVVCSTVHGALELTRPSQTYLQMRSTAVPSTHYGHCILSAARYHSESGHANQNSWHSCSCVHVCMQRRDCSAPACFHPGRSK